MKCVAISDTHGMYHDIDVPEGDLLIHAGDILGRGSLAELQEFNDWIGLLPHRHKIVIAGNHDWCFEKEENSAREVLTNAIYLQDESIVIEGIHFYGSPWQPWFMDWAFNLQRGEELRRKWELIPEATQVLITHGPAMGVLDQTEGGLNVGCEELVKAIARVKPQFHVFGHIHEGYGMQKRESCTYVNASVNTVRYRPTNPALVFEVL